MARTSSLMRSSMLELVIKGLVDALGESADGFGFNELALGEAFGDLPGKIGYVFSGEEHVDPKAAGQKNILAQSARATT